ncbi:MAG: hypothetical protein Q8L23_03880 [Caulobacter sp.]|nr:hypothetical protein [Caulobacter sp.]
MTISIRSVEKPFGRFPALNDVSRDIAPRELLAQLSREQGRTLAVGASTRVSTRVAHIFRA